MGVFSVPVLVGFPRVIDVPVHLEAVGTTRALNTVTIRTRVDGKLISVNFREGQYVKRGDILARIDPTPYRAQYDNALAKKELDEALLANAALDLQRYMTLAKTDAVSRQQLDNQRAAVAQLQAQLKLDQAQIDRAKAYLDFTTITSPVEGRTGIRLVDQGNVVHVSDPTGIVVITQIQPIAILFPLSQRRLGEISKALAEGPLTIEAINSDNDAIVDRGTLQVIDNQVDQATGTVQLKAEFPNFDLQLWPGEFVFVRLFTDTLRQVIVVPSTAVRRGPNGTFLYVVQPNNTVRVHPVTVGRQDEKQAVIVDGLQGDERIVIAGFVNLAEGRRVTVANAEGESRPPRGEPPAGSKGQGTGTGGAGIGRRLEAAPGAAQ